MGQPTLPFKLILQRKDDIDEALREAGIEYDVLTCMAIALMGKGMEDRGYVVKTVVMPPASKLVH